MGRAGVLLAVVSAALPWSGSACDVLALADTHPSPYLHAVYTRSGSANGRPDYAGSAWRDGCSTEPRQLGTRPLRKLRAYTRWLQIHFTSRLHAASAPANYTFLYTPTQCL